MDKEIIWNIVNSLLAGGLVLFGALSAGNVTLASFGIAIAASAVIAISQFKDYWNETKPLNKKGLFKLV